MDERSITKKMLETLRKEKVEQARKASQLFIKENEENDNFLTKAKLLMEEVVNKKKVLREENETDNSHNETYVIKKDTPQFGDVRISQESMLRKTIGENIELESNALVYYPDADDMTLSGKISSLNLSFQFRYNDPSGDGCYVWADAMQLTETNTRTLGKIRDAFGNWKDSITQDGDLMEKLKKASENDK